MVFDSPEQTRVGGRSRRRALVSRAPRSQQPMHVVIEMADLKMPEYSCEFVGCDKSFNRLSRLVQHERIHTKERPYACDFSNCNKSYARSSHLKRHLETAHGISSSSDEHECCSVCQQTFATKDTLKKHVLRVHTHKDNYLCPVEGCGRGFSKRFQLRHHEYEHNGVEPFQCHIETCKKRFAQRSHLHRHLKMHEGYKCNFENCGQIFDKWTQLRKHRAVSHRPDYSCNKCATVFSSKAELNKHSAKAHPSAELDIYVCGWEDCLRAYANKRNLAAHVRSFHENLRFTCTADGCVKTFSTLQKQKIHQKTQHEGAANKKRPHKKKSLAAQLARIKMKTLKLVDSESSRPKPVVDVVMEIEESDKNQTKFNEQPLQLSVSCNA